MPAAAAASPMDEPIARRSSISSRSGPGGSGQREEPVDVGNGVERRELALATDELRQRSRRRLDAYVEPVVGDHGTPGVDHQIPVGHSHEKMSQLLRGGS